MFMKEAGCGGDIGACGMESTTPAESNTRPRQRKGKKERRGDRVMRSFPLP
jgi:hypothetical protein